MNHQDSRQLYLVPSAFCPVWIQGIPLSHHYKQLSWVSAHFIEFTGYAMLGTCMCVHVGGCLLSLSWEGIEEGLGMWRVYHACWCLPSEGKILRS